MTDEAREPPDPGAPGSDELLRLVVESVTDFAIVATDPDGRVTGWNTGAERLLGYAADEIVGRDGNIIFTPEDRAAGAPEAERAQALAVGRAEDERWHIRKDGSRFWGSGLQMPLADRRRGFVKLMRDLTERHEAEARLRESEGLFRLLATNVPQLVFRSRSDGARTWGSPQWVAFTGLPFPASLGLGWLDAVHPDDREATIEAWREARRTGECYVEHRLRRSADGEYRWHQTRANPVPRDGVDPVDAEWVGTSTDVHDMRGLQDRQRVLLAELQHRTRNLLAVVQSIARQMLRAGGRSPEEFGAEFEGRLRALGRVQGLLAQVDHRAIDLRTLVGAELEAHGGGGSGGGFGPDKVSVDGPPASLPATSAQTLALAVHELATNAVKHGALKGPAGRLAVTWRIEGEGRRRRVALDWVESGVPMPEGGRPPRRGYGSELLERALPYQLKAGTRLEFGPDGVRCRIEAPVAADGEGADAP